MTILRVRTGWLFWFIGVCGTAGLLMLAWWVVNAQAACRYFAAYGETAAAPESHGLWYRFLTADLTTASPLMMLATFAFPLYAVWRRRRGRRPPDWLSDGYPRHWTLFVIYLGLAATLFGMVVALSAVGTEDVSSAERQQEQLTQLIAGTSTALVSSLVALVAVFATYWLKVALKRHAVVIDAESQGLDETIGELRDRISDLDGQFGRLTERIRSLDEHTGRLASTLDGTATRIQQQADAVEAIVKDMEEARVDLVQMPGQVEHLYRDVSLICEALVAVRSHNQNQMEATVALLELARQRLPELLETLEGLREIQKQQFGALGDLAALKELQQRQLDAFDGHARDLSELLERLRSEVSDVRHQATDRVVEKLDQLELRNQEQVHCLQQVNRDGARYKKDIAMILQIAEATRDTMLREREARLDAARALLGHGDGPRISPAVEDDRKRRVPVPPPVSEHK